MWKRKAVIGTVVMAGANALRLAAQLLILPIVARLLGPQAYGVIAFASPFVFFLLIIGDLGLAPTLVRAKDVTRDLESTIFWIAVTSGLALAGLLAGLAHPIGQLFGRPEVVPFLLGYTPLFLLVTAAVVPTARLQREGKFKSMAAIDITSAFIGMGAALYGCFAGWGAWTLIAQQLLMWMCRLSLVVAAARFLPRPVCRFSLVKSSSRFGAGIVGSAVFGFLSGNLDNVMIGTFLGTSVLGYYAIAYQIINIPNFVLGAVHYSLFPAISKAHNNDTSPVKTYLEALHAILLVAAPAMVGLALTADLLVALVLGDAWKPVGPLIQLLSLFGLLSAAFVLNASILLGIGRSDIEFRGTVMRTCGVVAGVVAGLPAGVQGVAAGVSIGFAIAGFFYMRSVMRTCAISAESLWVTVKAPLVSCVALGIGAILLRASVLGDVPALPALVLIVVSGFLAYVMALFFGFRASFLQDIVIIKGMITKKSF
jgi:O-antigen/teichoic acid export membrane protein